jgi:IS30 family transposase
VIRIHGGYAPPIRSRNQGHLSLPEREEISRGIAQHCSIREIARQLSRAPSTVSREIKRHGGVKLYRANEADSDALKRALRPKICKLALFPNLRELFAEKWSPQQISGWLHRCFPYDKDMQIFHETLYKSLPDYPFEIGLN